LDDIDNSSKGGVDEKNEFLQKLSLDPNVNFELNLTPTTAFDIKHSESSTNGSSTNEIKNEIIEDKSLDVFSCPLSKKFKYYRMKNLRSRKSVVRSMLWALGN